MSEANTMRVSPDVKLGANVRMFAFVNLYGCEIGDDSKIGTFVEIQKGAKIGKRVKVSGSVIAGSWDKKTNPMKFRIRTEGGRVVSYSDEKALFVAKKPGGSPG
jgi:carbonic anhydrase/acetyltransferase-like protein (isoleucine patch superfamily)